ncbi:uncharacterized protein LOC128745898 [Sabethes cyaneus]|uniref:uncharacterized protein LOC128745898 n=1 Tax=Sabethes cyaneus TaxID=53552 RepID=UPI00237EABA4|nr:uncharacterized protein LOC128745898 [Sabethes cyaneus]
MHKNDAHDCGACDRPNSADVGMVACDACCVWYHYSCARVSPGVENREWRCSPCLSVADTATKKPAKSSMTSLNVPDAVLNESSRALGAVPKKNKEKNPSARSVAPSEKSRRSNVTPKKNPEVPAVTAPTHGEKKSTKSCSATARGRAQLALQRLENERLLEELKLQGERERLKEERIRLEKEKQLKEQEHAIKAKELAMREKYLREKLQLEEQIADDDDRSESNASGGIDRTKEWVESQRHQNECDVGENGSKPAVQNQETVHKDIQSILCPSLPKGLHGAGLSANQVAARQIWPKNLPTFSGDPEEWPIFVHSYETANTACGFTDVENIIRLRECLRGPARDAVATKLMFPQSVNAIISTLKRLYGRPEILVKNLLDKVRRVEAPKSERLETLINFGLTVGQLCDHLEAANLQGHLSNPTLLGELVEKLPASIKLEWARFKRLHADPTLKHFGSFMEGLVNDASEVSSPVYLKTTTAKGDKDKPREKGHIYTHEEVSEVQIQNEKRQPCPICEKTDHRVRNCQRFQQMDVAARWEAVKRWNLCEVCLYDHGQWRCRSRFRCNVPNCRVRHHTLLHGPGTEQPRDHQQHVQASECNAHEQTPRSVLFRIIPVTLFGENRKCETFAFLDEGSSLTLIEENLASQIGIRGVPEPLELKWTSSVMRKENFSERVNFEIAGRGMPQRYKLKNAHTIRELNLPKQSLPIEELSRRFTHLQNLPISSYNEAVPKILLGLDNLNLFTPLDRCVGGPGEPIAVKSLLGWSVYGPDGSERTKHVVVNVHDCACGADRELNELVRQQFVLEDIAIGATMQHESVDEKRAREILESTTRFVDGKYETALLFKRDDVQLPNSFPMAMKRLKSFENQLAKDSNLRDSVNQQIIDYTRKGYIHKATKEELAEISGRTAWYLPLGLVTHPKKQKKRLVWDGKAEVEGISLNSQLLKGPDLLVALPSVICKFREKRVGFGGDIREMFLQLRMRTSDKYFQCFLFRFDTRHPPEIYIADVVMFGAACSPCVAQHVLRVNADKWAHEFPSAAAAIIEKTYMDDYYDSADSPAEASELAIQVRTIHARGGFEMRNWVSNSLEVVETLGEGTVFKEPRVLQSSPEDRWERVLGMLWHPESDNLMFSMELGNQLQPYVSGGQRPTKRIALKIIMSLFDPLGLLAPYLIHGRTLIQDVWRSGVQWDEEMRDEESEKWNRWVKLLPDIAKLQIPRCYFGMANPHSYSTLQCHVFTDASENGYGSAVYFRIVDNSKVKCSLVMAKSKVAPLKHISIPRLELEAAMLGARMLKTVLTNHSLTPREIYLWTDSSTVLSWIRSDHKKYKQFVAHRIGEILSLSQAEYWRWVPSKDNVADCLTKWVRDTEPESNSRWFKGPAFLYLNEEEWPKQKVNANTVEELRSCYLLTHISLPASIVDVSRFSKWTILLRTMVCVFRFISNCRLRLAGRPIETIPVTKNQVKLLKCLVVAQKVPLKQEEFQNAERFLWKMVQSEYYPDEVRILVKNRERPIEEWTSIERSSSLYRLSPFIDEWGIVRMDGRTANAVYANFDARFPIILPKDSPITRLLLHHYHCRYGHANKETIVNEIRQRFEISCLRSAVDKAAKNCQNCKIKKCKPLPPRMAPLPEQRLTPHVRPFVYVGIDYMGPLEVAVGRRREKRYVVVFTCLVVRAVHLEVSYDLSTESCIMAIRRFTRRRGSPLHIFTDNGTNFVGASRELKRQIEKIDSDCAGTFTDAQTKWSFNPPSAPHMGGVWERMVRSVKEAMESLDDGRKLTDEILWTTLIETEWLINARPLTYMPQEPTNPEALTPNHFILNGSSGAHEPLEPSADLGKVLRGSFQRSQQLADAAWDRWSKEYFPTINRRTKWLSDARSLKVGDLVYITEGGRRAWIRGIVDEVIRGKDGRIRQAIVTTATGKLKRPAVKLAVMEVGGSSDPPLDPRGGGCSGSTDDGDETLDIQNPVQVRGDSTQNNDHCINH